MLRVVLKNMPFLSKAAKSTLLFPLALCHLPINVADAQEIPVAPTHVSIGQPNQIKSTPERQDWEELERRIREAQNTGKVLEKRDELIDFALKTLEASTTPEDILRSGLIAVRLSQVGDQDQSSTIRSTVVDSVIAHKFDIAAFNDTERKVFYSFLTDGINVRADATGTFPKAYTDESYKLLRKLAEASTSDVASAAIYSQIIRNRIIVERVLGGMKAEEREALVAEIKKLVEKIGDRDTPDGQTFAEYAERNIFEIEHLSVGKVAPEIEAVDLDLNPMKLSDFRGKTVVVTIWASWCQPCLEQIPKEIEFYNKYKDRDVVFVGINGDADADDAKKVEETYKVPWRSFYSEHGGPETQKKSVPWRWNVTFWPSVYIIDPEGVIRYKRCWDTDFQQLETAIKAILRDAK